MSLSCSWFWWKCFMFFFQKWSWLWAYCILLLLYWYMPYIFLNSPASSSWKDILLVKRPVCISWDDSVVSVLEAISVVVCIYWFTSVEPSLHFWDKVYLIMMDDLFDVLLNLVWKYFIGNISVFIRETGLKLSLLLSPCLVLVSG